MVSLKFLIVIAVYMVLAPPTVVIGCTNVHLQCTGDCTRIILCPFIGSDMWNLVDCKALYGKYCTQNPSTGDFECSAELCSSPVIPHNFRCIGTGNFPSAYNCDVSYVCEGPGKWPALTCTCDSGQYYDTVTETCVPEPGCPLIPADCSTYGRIGNLGNGFCYSCTAYYETALVHLCPSTTTTLNMTTPIRTGNTRGMTCTEYVPPETIEKIELV